MCKRIVSPLLVLAIMLSASVCSATEANEITANSTSNTLILSYTDSNDNLVELYSVKCASGFTQIDSYVNEKIVSSSILDKSSSIITTTRYDSSFSSCAENSITTVNVDDYLSLSTYPSTMLARESDGSTFLGYVVYNGINLSIQLRVTVEYDLYYDSMLDILAPEGEIATFILAVSQEIPIPIEIIADFVGMLGSLGILDIIGDEIIEENTITVHARAYDEVITATNTDDPTQSGAVSGTYYYITEEGYEGVEEKEGFTHLDWGNNYFGKQLFYVAIGVEYTPSFWIDGG